MTGDEYQAYSYLPGGTLPPSTGPGVRPGAPVRRARN